MDKVFLDNTIKEWLIALSIIVSSLLILRIIQAIAINRIKKFTARTKTTVDDFIVSVVQSSLMPLLYVIAFFAGLHYLQLPEKAVKILRIALMVAATFFVIKMITAFISYVFRKGINRQVNEQRQNQAKGIMLIIQVVIWVLGLLFLVDNLGYNITTIVAGLGIGGIAIALAAQTILGDLFSYLVIFFDKPFEIGDFIIVDEKLGTVEYIGIKTTHIRTLNGEQLICSNTDLTNSRVHNYKRMNERRIVFKFGVIYRTSADQLEKMPGDIKKIVTAVDKTRFDRAHFFAFGDSSLDFEVVYYVLSSDYNLYIDIQQQINLKLIKLFEKEALEFAFPTRTIHIQSAGKI